MTISAKNVKKQKWPQAIRPAAIIIYSGIPGADSAVRPAPDQPWPPTRHPPFELISEGDGNRGFHLNFPVQWFKDGVKPSVIVLFYEKPLFK